MKKIHLYLAFIFCTIVSFTGCYPTGDKRINENEISNYVSNANEPNDSIPSKLTWNLKMSRFHLNYRIILKTL